MRRFIINISIFSIGVVCIVAAFMSFSRFFLKMTYGINTKEQIERSFTQAKQSDANIWFLGNSRIYRGIDPSAIKTAKTYNFAHDNDSFNQMYYKFLWLEENNCTIDTLVIGVDYFQFGVCSDTRNYVYDYLFDEQYAKDYGRSSVSEKFFNMKREFLSVQGSSYGAILKFLARGCKFPSADELPKLKYNGQYVYNTKASPSDKTNRKCEMEEIPVRYFDYIVRKCTEEFIALYVIMPPVRDNELSCYSAKELDDFNKMIKSVLNKYGYHDCYFNYSNLPEFKDYTCYTDITHLNSESAYKFTDLLWNTIN